MERASKRSRSATKPAKSAGKRKHSSKSAAVGKLNRQTAKLSAARTLANAVTMGFLGIEKKFYDTKLADTAVSTATTLNAGMQDPSASSMISTPVQGDGEQNRDGKRIVIDSLILKGHVINVGSASETVNAQATKVFVAVVLDTQTNGAQMTSDACFKSLANQASSNVDPMKNLLSGKRFRILKSQVYDVTPPGIVSAAGTLATNGIQREIDWYIPFKGGLPVNFNAGTTADVTNVVDNSIHIVAFGTDANTQIGYNARIRFQG